MAAVMQACTPEVAQLSAQGLLPAADLPEQDPVGVDVRLLAAPLAPQHLGGSPAGDRCSSGSGGGTSVKRERPVHGQVAGQGEREGRRQLAAGPLPGSPGQRGDHAGHIVAVHGLGHALEERKKKHELGLHLASKCPGRRAHFKRWLLWCWWLQAQGQRRQAGGGRGAHHIPNLGGAVPAAQCSARHANIQALVSSATRRLAASTRQRLAGHCQASRSAACTAGRRHNPRPPREQDVWALEIEVCDALGVEEHQAPRHIQRNLQAAGGATRGVLSPPPASSRTPQAASACAALFVGSVPQLAPPTFLPRRYQLTRLAAMLCSRSPPSMYSVTSIVWSGPRYAPCTGQGRRAGDAQVQAAAGCRSAGACTAAGRPAVQQASGSWQHVRAQLAASTFAWLLAIVLLLICLVPHSCTAVQLHLCLVHASAA
jgi:hypothetical protein